MLLAAIAEATGADIVFVNNGVMVEDVAKFGIGANLPAAEELCRGVSREFPRATFFSGRLIFQRERWYQRLLHNETALAIQKRLQWSGRTMVLMPIRVR